MHTHNPPQPGRPLWFTLRAAFKLELKLIESQMAQEPMLRGEVGARALCVRSCLEGRYGRARVLWFTLRGSFMFPRGVSLDLT